MNRHVSSRSILIAAWLSCVVSSAARAQDVFNRDPKAAYLPRIDSASLNQVVEQMNVGDDVQHIVFALRSDLVQFYSTQGAAAEKSITESMEAMLAYSEAHGVHPLNAVGHDFDYTRNLADWRLTRQRREEQFNRDVAAVLPVEKQDWWFDFVWHNRRQRTIYDLNAYLGSRRRVPVLPEIVAGMNHAEAAATALESAIREHLRELDQRLRNWEREFIEALLKQHDLAVRQFRGQISQERLIRESPDITISARDIRKWVINDATNMAALLPADLRREFERAIATAAEPAIYHRSPVEEVVDQLLDHHALDDARREAIRSIDAEYNSRLAPMRRRMILVNDEWIKPENRRDRYQRKLAMNEADPQADTSVIDTEHPILEILPKRRQLEFQTLKTIRGLFTPNELKSLPPAARYLLQFGADVENHR